LIPDAEAKRIARALGVDALVIDLDHALGVALWSLSVTGLGDCGWVFKGGTCLRKSYFEGYRFSEDLDFTAERPISPESVAGRIRAAAEPAASLGVTMLVDQLRCAAQSDEYGRQTIKARVPYRGAVARTGAARVLQFDVSADETLCFRSVQRPLLHPYSDAPGVVCELPAYALEEAMAEKLRAIAGQRQYAVARDVYHNARLCGELDDLDAALGAVPAKAAHKGLDLTGCGQRFAARRDEFAASWERHIAGLLAAADDISFDHAFDTCVHLLGRL
jgi:predicted nucleotidyltransferase component of viral defense system